MHTHMCHVGTATTGPNRGASKRSHVFELSLFTSSNLSKPQIVWPRRTKNPKIGLP